MLENTQLAQLPNNYNDPLSQLIQAYNTPKHYKKNNEANSASAKTRLNLNPTSWTPLHQCQPKPWKKQTRKCHWAALYRTNALPRVDPLTSQGVQSWKIPAGPGPPRPAINVSTIIDAGLDSQPLRSRVRSSSGRRVCGYLNLITKLMMKERGCSTDCTFPWGWIGRATSLIGQRRLQAMDQLLNLGQLMMCTHEKFPYMLILSREQWWIPHSLPLYQFRSP
jgi:hypothetical protein